MQDSPQRGVLAPGQRKDLFDCIEEIRKLKRDDRIVQKLKKHLDFGTGFANGFFTVNTDVWYNGDKCIIREIEEQIKSAGDRRKSITGGVV